MFLLIISFISALSTAMIAECTRLVASGCVKYESAKWRMRSIISCSSDSMVYPVVFKEPLSVGAIYFFFDCV